MKENEENTQVSEIGTGILKDTLSGKKSRGKVTKFFTSD